MKLKIQNVFAVALIFIAAVLSSCGNSSIKTSITHLPVQLKTNSNWSLWDITTGSILFEGEFKQVPSVVSEGVFSVKNEKGELFYYKIEDDKKYKQIAGPYKRGSIFSEGLAIVCKEDGYPAAINSSGEDVFTLEPQEGIVFKVVGQCIDGYIKFQGENGLWGFIDKKGKIAIKPQFDYVDDFRDGLARASRHSDSKDKLLIIDNQGATVTEIDKSYVGEISNKKMVYSDIKDEFGIIGATEAKEKILSASSKYEGISIHNNDVFYKSDGDWGMLDDKFEVAVRAKYKSLTRLDGDVLLGVKVDGKEVMYELINKAGDIIKKDEVDGGVNYGAFNLRNGNFLVKDGKDFQIMNAKGEMVGNNTVKDCSGFENIVQSVSGVSDIVESDYFDWNKLKEYISSIKPGSLAGFNLGVDCIQASNSLSKIGNDSKDNKVATTDQGKGLVFANRRIDWGEHNGIATLLMGSGYEGEDVLSRQKAQAGQQQVSSQMGKLPNPSQSQDAQMQNLPDNAPEWQLYQYSISKEVSFGKSGSMKLNVSFDDYLKKAKTVQTEIDNGYTTYMEEKIVGYEKNPEAKVSGVLMELTVIQEKEDKLKTMIEEAFAKGFTLVGTQYGIKYYNDASGNKWEVKGTVIKLNQFTISPYVE